MMAGQKLSPVVRELPQDVTGIFKDSYLLDFIDLPEPYVEKDLQSALVKNLCRFLLEFLGTWEEIYNPDFKVVEFDPFFSGGDYQ